MFQLAALGLAALVGFYCWHKLQQELAKLEAQDRAEEEAKRAEKRTEKRKNSQTLSKDPETGVYKLDDD